MNEDYGDLPLEDYTHLLLHNVIIIKWLLFGILIFQGLELLL